MANLNKVFLMGRLARDPELRYIPSGTAVATFTVASNRAYTMASGEKREETCFVRIVAWGRQAELCGEYLTKGAPVFVEGRMQSRSWETPDGQKRSTLEVVAQNVQFLGKPMKGRKDLSMVESPQEPMKPAAVPEAETAAPSDLPEFSPETEGGEVPF